MIGIIVLYCTTVIVLYLMINKLKINKCTSFLNTSLSNCLRSPQKFSCWSRKYLIVPLDEVALRNLVLIYIILRQLA